ncbi:hypothetical protein [Geminocystis sp.]|uniref:hypothetical protein n=1 Tax=Geminocystis sp. TaxID=2664100 RepID=UPI0035935CB6
MRRGLTGSIIFWLRENFNLNNPQTFFMVVYFNYLIFLVWSIIYLIKVNKSLRVLTVETILIFLFLPSLLLFPINDIGGLGRKEYLFFFGLLINLWLVSQTVTSLYLSDINQVKQELNRKTIDKYCYQLFIFYNLFSIPTALSHEAILFLVLPLNILISLSILALNNLPIKTIKKIIIIYSPTIIVALISLIFNGNKEVVVSICKSWQEYNLVPNCQELPEVLSYYTYSTFEAIQETFKRNILYDNGLRFFSWITAFFLSKIILMRASEITISKTVEEENRRLYIKNESLSFSPQEVSINFSFKYFFIPFIGSFILYIIAFDWGRWFMTISITYAVCLLTPSLIKLKMYSYQKNQELLKIIKPIYNLYSHIISFFQNKFDIKKYYLIYFILLIYTLFFIRITHYDMNFIDLSNGFIPIHYYTIFS